MIEGTVSAVVVTWNSKQDIAECLDSLLNQSAKPTEIIVVDNASSDGTPDLISSRYPQIKLIRLATNEGFAKGNNIGIRSTDSAWVVLLNPDARLETGWIECLLNFAADNPAAGALGGVLWSSGGGLPDRTLIDSTGIEIYKSRRVRDSGFGEGNAVLPVTPVRVFGICAAAVLLKRKMLDDIAIDGEIFPERFFCYYEDADLAWRAWRRGWQAWTIPAAEGFHRRGGSPIGSRFSRYYTHRNRLWMIIRNDEFYDLFRAIPEICIHELLMLARVIRYPYLLKAVWQSLGGVGRSLGERRRLQSNSSDPVPFQPGVGFSRSEQNKHN